MTRHRTLRAAAVALAGVAVSACGSSAFVASSGRPSWYPSTPLPSPPSPGASVTPATAVAPVGVGEAINTGLGTPAQQVAADAQLKFAPASITVSKGQVIQWTNTSNVPHNVTFDAQPSLSSGTLQQNGTWQVEFTAPGTYQYHCTFHPGMTGSITVAG